VLPPRACGSSLCCAVLCTGIRFPGSENGRSYCDIGRKYLIGATTLSVAPDTSAERKAAREWLTGSFEFDITELEGLL
jgi:hypothetical protein